MFASFVCFAADLSVCLIDFANFWHILSLLCGDHMPLGSPVYGLLLPPSLQTSPYVRFIAVAMQPSHELNEEK